MSLKRFKVLSIDKIIQQYKYCRIMGFINDFKNDKKKAEVVQKIEGMTLG